jgi:hypothetical protein
LKTPRLFLAAVVAALVGWVLVVAPPRSAAGASPTGDGGTIKKTYQLRPDGLVCGNSTFGIRDLAPSIHRANETRLQRVRLLEAWYAASSAACARAWYPGCDDVERWRAQRAQPWPVDHWGDDPERILSDRVGILSADDTFSIAAYRVLAHDYCDALSQQTYVPSNAQGPCMGLLQAEADADATLLGPKGIPDAGRKRGAGASDGGPSDAGASEAVDFDDVRRFYEHLRTSPSPKRLWRPTESAIALAFAARMVPVDPPPFAARPLFAPAESEEAALQRNETACQNSDFYVGPNHEVIRRKMTVSAAEPLTVCVDTPSFAVDQPVELTVSTPSQKNVLLLWPGEPRPIPMDLRSGAHAEIVHLTVSGYPRADLLRSLARHADGPLANTDSFAVLEQATAGQGESSPTSYVAALQSFQSRAKKSGDLIVALGALNDALAVTGDAGADAAQPLNGAQTLQRRIRTVAAEEQSLLDSPLTDAKVKKSVSNLVPNKDDVDVLVTPRAAQALGQTVGSFLSDLDTMVQSAKAVNPSQGNFDLIADEMCQLTTTVVPLVEEDLLVKPRDAGNDQSDPYLVEYDFAGGFLGQLKPADLNEGENVFVMVRNVQPGYSIGVSIDGHTVLHRDLQLVGFSQQALDFTPDGEKTQTARTGVDSLNVYRLQEQPPATQILSLGTFVGGSRYTIRVCAATGGADCTSGQSETGGSSATADAGTSPDAGAVKAEPARPTTHVIGVNSLVVHGRQHLGVRAGAGITYDLGQFRDLASEPGIAGSVVRQRENSWNFSLPLLLAGYPGPGRDSVGMPPRCSWGVVGGFDLLHVSATPRIYFPGVVVDFYGLGLTLSLTEERLATISNPVGSIVNGNQQTDYLWQWGAYFGVTTDFDIFEAVYQKLFTNTSIPSVPGSQ